VIAGPAVIVVQVAITVAFLPLAAGGVFESNRFRQRAEGIGADRYPTASVGGEDDSFAGEEWYEVVGMVRDFGWQLPLPHEQSAMYHPRLVLRKNSVRARVPTSC